jgi:hypothetical protein
LVLGASDRRADQIAAERRDSLAERWAARGGVGAFSWRPVLRVRVYRRHGRSYRDTEEQTPHVDILQKSASSLSIVSLSIGRGLWRGLADFSAWEKNSARCNAGAGFAATLVGAGSQAAQLTP